MSLPNEAMKVAARRLLRILGAVVFLVLLNATLLGMAWHALRSTLVIFDPWEESAASHFKRFVPAKFGSLSVYAYGGNDSLLAALAFQRKFCGGMAFRITDDIVATIEAQGIAWFQGVREGRAPRQGEDRPPIRWDDWQASPVPASWIGDSGWKVGLECLVDADRRLSGATVYDAIRRTGTYYTASGQLSQILLIVPLRLLIFTYEK